MLFWFLDRALLIYVILALLAIGLALVYRNHRDRHSAIALAVVVALGVLLFVLSLLVVTDKQQIAKNIHAMRDAVLANKPQDLVKHFAPDFKFQDYDREAIAKALPMTGKFVKIVDIVITGMDVQTASRSEGGRAVFMATAHASDGPYPPVRCEADFVFSNHVWLLRAIEIKDLKDRPIRIPIR
jgi:hypothetical protein